MDVPAPRVKIVPRSKWNAVPPTSTEPLPHPIGRIFFMFTDTTRCESKEECIKSLQELQRDYMDKGMSDIPFSFLIGGDLRVYEGRGWQTKVTRPDVKDWNSDRLVIGYICEAKVDDDKTDKMIDKAYDLMDDGIDNKLLLDFNKNNLNENDNDDESIALRKEYNREYKEQNENKAKK